MGKDVRKELDALSVVNGGMCFVRGGRLMWKVASFWSNDYDDYWHHHAGKRLNGECGESGVRESEEHYVEKAG